MSWPTQKLETVADFCLGKMLDQKKNRGEHLPYLANVNVRWGEFDLADLREMRFEQHELDRYGLKYGDIVMCEGGEPGRCAIWKEQCSSMMIQKALHRIRPHDCLRPEFLYYFFLYKGRTGHLASLFTGSTIKHLPREKLALVEVPVPPHSTQDQIASVLSAYDDLIENNRRRIQLLEQAARLLYKEWFVHLRFPGHEHTPVIDGVPEGWEKMQVKDLLAKVKRPGKIQKADYLSHGPIPCIDQSREFIGGYTNQIETMIDELPMIVFGDHTRILKFIDFPFACGADGTQLLATHDPKISQEFFFFSLDEIDLSNYFYARHFKFLKDQHILRPTDVLIDQFTGVARPILKQIKILREQNASLAKARDLLLPKLMNREVAV